MLSYYNVTFLFLFFIFSDIFMISETLSEIFVWDYKNKTFNSGTQPRGITEKKNMLQAWANQPNQHYY